MTDKAEYMRIWRKTETGKRYQESYSKSPARRAAAARHRKKKKEDLREQLYSRPCADCGGTFPRCVMEFHHRERSPGNKRVSNLIAENRSVSTIMAEVAKCDLLCANCHAIRDHEEDVLVAERRVM